MSLHYILDGYNIIKSEAGRELARGTLEQQRNGLVDLIRETRPQGSPANRISVVFDGRAEHPYWSAGYNRSHVGEIEVIFSEGGSADDVIRTLVEERVRGIEMVVVTNDRGIRRTLGGTGTRFLSVEEFLARAGSSGRRREPGRTAESDAITEELSRRWLDEKDKR